MIVAQRHITPEQVLEEIVDDGLKAARQTTNADPEGRSGDPMRPFSAP